MKAFPSIEDLRAARAAQRAEDVLRLRRRRLLQRRRRCAPTAPTWSASSCASACWSTSTSASTATTILGEPVPLPLALGPIGLGGMMHGDGEILACRAAQAAGIPYTLSTMSINSIEDVAAAVDKPFWFQLYVMRDRGFIRELIQRARRRSAAR